MKKFEVEQKWLNKKGEVIVIKRIDNSSKWPILASDGKMYAKNGRYFTAVESDEDLVELVDDNLGNTENVDVSAVVDTTPDLDFKVGQKWRRRDGKVVEITNVLQDHNYPIITNTGTYTLKGELVEGQTRYNDLVELYADASESELVTYLVPGYENVPIRIGDVWLTNDGRTRKVVGLCMGDTYPIKAEAICTTTTMSREVIKLEFTLAGIFNLNSKESDANLKTLVTSEEDTQYIIDEGDPFNELVSDMCDNSNLTEESFKEEAQPLTINPFAELNDAEVVELVKGQSICTATCSNQEVRPSFATSIGRLLEQITNEIKRYNINMLENARTMEELSQVNFNVTALIHKVKALEEEVNKLKD